MNRVQYICRNKDTESKMNYLIRNFNFALAYKNKREMIVKNAQILISLKKRYVLLISFSIEDEYLIKRMKEYLMNR